VRCDEQRQHRHEVENALRNLAASTTQRMRGEVRGSPPAVSMRRKRRQQTTHHPGARSVACRAQHNMARAGVGVRRRRRRQHAQSSSTKKSSVYHLYTATSVAAAEVPAPPALGVRVAASRDARTMCVLGDCGKEAAEEGRTQQQQVITSAKAF
jgi:hypothetical protein